MPKLDMSPRAVRRRLEEAAALSDLSVFRALEGKVNLSPTAVSARLRTVAQLRTLGLRLQRAGRAADRIDPEPPPRRRD
jgi:hypothetical protein